MSIMPRAKIELELAERLWVPCSDPLCPERAYKGRFEDTRRICDTCQGTGRIWPLRELCHACGGAKRVSVRHNGELTTVATSCWACAGRGWVPTEMHLEDLAQALSGGYSHAERGAMLEAALEGQYPDAPALLEAVKRAVLEELRRQ